MSELVELEARARMLRGRITALRIDHPEAADERRDQLAWVEGEIAVLRASPALPIEENPR